MFPLPRATPFQVSLRTIEISSTINGRMPTGDSKDNISETLKTLFLRCHKLWAEFNWPNHAISRWIISVHIWQYLKNAGQTIPITVWNTLSCNVPVSVIDTPTVLVYSIQLFLVSSLSPSKHWHPFWVSHFPLSPQTYFPDFWLAFPWSLENPWASHHSSI